MVWTQELHTSWQDWTLMVTSAQDVKTSVTTNSPFRDYFHPKIKFCRSMKAFCQAQNYLFSVALSLYNDLAKQTECFGGENKLSIVYSLQATWTNCIILQVHRPFPVWLHRQAMPWTVVDQWKKNFWRKWKSWAMRCLLTLWINSSMIWEDQIMLPR